MNKALQPHRSLPIQSTTVICFIALFLASCNQTFSVSVNNQAVYDPAGQYIGSEVSDADLQGCINLAVRQQNVQSAAELTVLSCASSEIRQLENIGQLASLRFLDLANNNITNITPLEDLPVLGGLNLMNNAINDIAPLLNIQNLASVSLVGNNNIPCSQLAALRTRLGNNLSAPDQCRN